MQSGLDGGIGGIILAGGKSRRMGENKAFMRIGNEYVIQRVISKLRLAVDEIRIVVSKPIPPRFEGHQDYMKLGAPVVFDLFPDKGPLGGIHAGLLASKYEYNLLVGCDMPFLNVPLLKYMTSQSRGYELTLPKFGSRYHPLCAVYAKSCIPLIKSRLESERLKLEDLIYEVNLRTVEEPEIVGLDPDGSTFFNLNTRAEYQEAIKISRILE